MSLLAASKSAVVRGCDHLQQADGGWQLWSRTAHQALELGGMDRISAIGGGHTVPSATAAWSEDRIPCLNRSMPRFAFVWRDRFRHDVDGGKVIFVELLDTAER